MFDQITVSDVGAQTIAQGYSNGGPRSESGLLDGDGRTSSVSERSRFF